MTATPFLLGDRADLGALAAAADECRGCPLWRHADHAVFGEGPPDAELVLVGEQPGDREDREGRPFVGPAGRELNRILEEAGIDRRSVYLTNAVKHFKYRESGKRRLHDTPNRNEVKACRPWLDRELQLIEPRALVALGATAARELFGTGVRVTADHGHPVESDLAGFATVTWHPSAAIRPPDRDRREALRAAITADLATVVEWLG